MSFLLPNVPRFPGLFLLSFVVALGLLPSPLGAQGPARVVTEENIRAEPRGIVLGRVLPGGSYSVVSVEEQWVEVQLDGWIWTRSIQDTDRMGFDLRVSVSPQENLRDGPSGSIIARLVEGTLLNDVEETTDWTRVQRAVWIWRESVELAETPASIPVETDQDLPPVPEEPQWWRANRGPAPLLSGPDGDTLALAGSGTDLRILAREGNWIRVRLEGWTWAPEGEAVAAPEESGYMEITPTTVVADPDRYRGRTFSWELQYVSLERAEKIRTDFYEGEPFLLTRVPDSPGLFVYVAVPPDQVSELVGLIPLERILVVGRLRTGAAALTGNPILDLMELSRIQRNQE